MHSSKRLLPLIAGSAMLVGLSTIASAESYTMTFDDIPAVAMYGTLMPTSYAPPELAGSGIDVTFTGYNSSGQTPVGVFYGDPISSTSDHTPGGSGADIYVAETGWGGLVEMTFSQPVYLTSVWVSGYAYPAVDGDAAALAVAREITVSGYTNIADTTPAISTTVAGANHFEPWRGPSEDPFTHEQLTSGVDELKWRDVIALGNTPITKVTFFAVSFPQIDDITISTTPVTPLFGDFNRNGEVDIGDYTIWADTYDTWNDPAYIGLPRDAGENREMTHGVDLRADANGNGYIDIGDYTTWADTYGQGSAPLTVDITPVPEPASLALIALGGLAVLARRRK